MFHFQFLGWKFLFLTRAVQETEKSYNYVFGFKLIMNKGRTPCNGPLSCVHKSTRNSCVCVLDLHCLACL